MKQRSNGGFWMRSLAAVGLLASLGSTASAQPKVVDFSELGYGGDCNWQGGPEIGTSYPESKFDWYGLKSLDLQNYQTCWSESLTPTQDNGYATSGVVALGTGRAQVQSSAFNPFYLTDLTVGSGWLNGITLVFKGYSAEVAGDPTTVQQIVLNAANAVGKTEDYSVWSINSGPIRAFTIDVIWGLVGMQDWRGVGPIPQWSGDPFNSRLRNSEAERVEIQEGRLGGYTGNPYQTYFLSGMTVDFLPPPVVLPPPTVVPEPSTFALIAAGLAALGIVARRRKRA